MSKKIFVLTICSLFLLIPLNVGADMGMIPLEPVDLDESAQNAIIGWNGKEEVIILSTDVQSTRAVPVLRVIPLPNNPSKVEEGSFDSFETMVDLYNSKSMRYPEAKLEDGTMTPLGPAGVEITFHEKIGAHDVTVVKVNDFAYFLHWVEYFSEQQGLPYSPLSLDFIDAVEGYLYGGIQFFVFDLIEADQNSQSIKPLVYRFPSPALYYPMAITAYSDAGDTYSQVDLFIVTRGVLESYRGIYSSGLSLGPDPYSYYEPVNLSNSELKSVDSELAGLFDRGAQVNYLTYSGRLSQLTRDLIIALDDVYVSLKDDDLVKTPSSGTVYLIQNQEKYVFGHQAVYESWGYPDDFSIVYPISESNLSGYSGDDPIPFREGTVFRGTATSLHGKAASCVFVVGNGKIRPIKSAAIYQALYNDSKWENVKWIPDDYLSKFSYVLGEEVTSSDVHPDGTLVKAPDSDDIYVIEDGQARHIEKWSALINNRYYNEKTKEFAVPFVVTNKAKSYTTASPITSTETNLIRPEPAELKAQMKAGCSCSRR